MHSLFEKTADFRHSPKAEAKYGPVGLWDVSKVTSMGELFMGCINFNEDISAWDVRCTESLCYNQFAYASSFNHATARCLGCTVGRELEPHVRLHLER